MTKDGDIVAFGIDKLPEEQMTAQEFIDYVNEQGGTCTAAHPLELIIEDWKTN